MQGQEHTCRFCFCGDSQSLNGARLCYILVPRACLTYDQQSMTRVAVYENGFASTAGQSLASEREQNAKCANVMFMRILWVFQSYLIQWNLEVHSQSSCSYSS